MKLSHLRLIAAPANHSYTVVTAKWSVHLQLQVPDPSELTSEERGVQVIIDAIGLFRFEYNTEQQQIHVWVDMSSEEVCLSSVLQSKVQLWYNFQQQPASDLSFTVFDLSQLLSTTSNVDKNIYLIQAPWPCDAASSMLAFCGSSTSTTQCLQGMLQPSAVTKRRFTGVISNVHLWDKELTAYEASAINDRDGQPFPAAQFDIKSRSVCPRTHCRGRQ